MLYKLDEKGLEIVKKVEKLTFSDFALRGEFIEAEMLETALEELMYEYEALQENYEDLAKNLEENYKPIPVDLGLSDRDFY